MIVGSNFCGSVVASTKITFSGGSSNVFSNALNELIDEGVLVGGEGGGVGCEHVGLLHTVILNHNMWLSVSAPLSAGL